MQDNSDWNRRTHVKVGRETVTEVSGNDFPGFWPGEENAFDAAAFTTNLVVKLGHLTNKRVELDLVGVDASIANAYRRTMLAEVPTVAVENVYVWNNTSIVQDEVLAQRLGLVALNIDPTKVEFKQLNEDPTDLNTIVFSLVVRCDRFKTKPAAGETRPEKLYKNSSVYSSAFEWQAKGVQVQTFEDNPPRPVDDDILLAKMRPGQEILLEMHCEKGIGKDHAKWSPVSTASYRLLPTIHITKPIPSDLCDKFAGCFAPGVIEVEKDENGNKVCKVVNSRKDTVSREVLRHPEFEDSVILGRKRDHFIFTIESAGQYPAKDLLPAATTVLLEKVRTLRSALDGL